MSEPIPLVRRERPFPRTLPEFSNMFVDESACEEVLRRWKYGEAGFCCPRCGGTAAWSLSSRHLDECKRCHKQVSLTAGTIMQGTRKPLRLWFMAMFLFVVSKQGVSALDLQRQLGLGSYQTAWCWLHKLRSALGRRNRTMLEGLVEADETYEGGIQEGNSGRSMAGGKKALIAAAVERKEPKGLGRVRLAVLSDASAASIAPFLRDSIAPGATLLTDGWPSYGTPAKSAGYEHKPTNVSKSGRKAHEILPCVHRVFSLVHRVLLTTYQGAVSHKHLPAYLAEFEFRFNRRTSRSRGLLFQRLLSLAMAGQPPYYWQIVGRRDPKLPLRRAA